MRVIIAGSRTITEYALVEQAVRESGFQITEVLSGGARGVDQLGEAWARRTGIPVRCFAADWERFGKRAGYVRNEQMAGCAEGVIAVWDGSSPGTSHMIGIAREKGLKVFVLRPEERPAQDPGSGRVIYDRTFYPDSGRVEARAVIVDYSDRDHVQLRFGITEQDMVTFKDKRMESCAGVPADVRRLLWRELFEQARGELEREIRVATDPHYDLPEREIY
jgi:hypothetical protein